ncbi:MAG TPA: hypothetical protein VMU43_05175 [Candidatus Acidoferrum sp.]|nr:hypothetical protein [Candidatus Acidoferrum sp.]
MNFCRGTFKNVGLLALLALLWAPTACAQQKQTMPDMPGMDMNGAPNSGAAAQQETPAQRAAEIQSTKESEFNHHLSGLLVFIAGLAILLQDRIRPYWPGVRYVLSVCFLLGGIYLLVFSDTEIWPFGPQTFWYAITHNPEDLQHKTFSIILLFLGAVEFSRVKGWLTAEWAKWAFPVMAFAGSVMLLFHKHSPGMHGAHSMAVMMQVKAEHRGFAAAGFGIAIGKGLSEGFRSWRPVMEKVWPLMLMVLGVLLMIYTE